MSDPTEAHIETVWPQYTIEDLGIHLKFGDEGEYVAKSLVDGSKDFKEGKDLGALRVQWVRRCRVKKPPRNQAPPSARRIVRAPLPKPKAEVDEEAIADRVAEKLAAKMAKDETTRQKREQQAAKLQRERDVEMQEKLDRLEALAAQVAERSQGGEDNTALAEILQTLKAMPAQQVVTAGGTVAPVSEGPLYIPDVRTDIKSDIRPKESTSDAGKAMSSAEKLKALRDRKKKKVEKEDDK